jgi:tetratricopeptide (TPR) repeat protein
MAQNWATQLDGHRCASLRLLVMQHVASELKFAGDGERCAWHAAQALATRNSRDSASTLWHYCRARDPAGVIRTLRRSAGLLAVWPETDELVREADGLECTPHQRVDLWLARAQVERTRRKSSNELFAYEQARRVAQAAEAPLLLGIVHSALGRYYDLRDTDRALSFYQDSVEFLREERSALHNGDALGHFVVALARLAWLYLLRNDGRSKPLLDKAENLRREHSVPTEALGVLEQAWGEYWHRAGDKVRSLEHRYRALNIFERLGDERSIVATQVNIAFDLAVRGERGRAIEALRQTLQAARAGVLEGEQAFVVHLNLGENLCSAGDYEGAIEHGQLALSRSLADGLTLGAFNARYNLAEAHYMRFRDLGNPSDESAGDELVQAALIEPGRDVPPSSLALLRKLKDTVLGVKQLPEPYRLLPREMAIHYQEVDEIERQRLNLAIPTDPESQARAQLAIARAYLIISTKEREAALALIHKHGLQARFAVEFDDLKQAFNRGLTREQQLADGWKQSAADLVDDARRAPLIAHLMREGSINKSRYAQLHGVSLATASKHLGLLTERGLLIQRGKGPSTRYELPK